MFRKGIQRVKITAEQYIGRAEKSEVLSDDLQSLEKRLDLIKQVCNEFHKKLAACKHVSHPGLEREKRLKKFPETILSQSMIESANLLDDTLLGEVFNLYGQALEKVASARLDYEIWMDQEILMQFGQLLDNDIPAIQKLRKNLHKLTLDMDAAKHRFHSAHKQNSPDMKSHADEMEEAGHRMQQCLDQLATEMYTFIAKEPLYSSWIESLVNSQIEYHKKTLDTLERLQPQLAEKIERSAHAPVYGVPLEDHLKRTGQPIATVIEQCIGELQDYISEEGLFRVAGSTARLKKLKAAFNSGYVDMKEYTQDVHCIPGALKSYLRELPEPLLTYELFDEWLHALQSTPDSRLQCVWSVLQKLPKANFNNLRYLIKFLAKLSENQDVNKMSASNIAIVIGPNLMWRRMEQAGSSMVDTGSQSMIAEILIANVQYFFPGDSDLSSDPFSPPAASSSASSPFSQSVLPPSQLYPVLPHDDRSNGDEIASLNQSDSANSSDSAHSSALSLNSLHVDVTDGFSTNQSSLHTTQRLAKKPHAPPPPPPLSITMSGNSPSSVIAGSSPPPPISEKPQFATLERQSKPALNTEKSAKPSSATSSTGQKTLPKKESKQQVMVKPLPFSKPAKDKFTDSVPYLRNISISSGNVEKPIDDEESNVCPSMPVCGEGTDRSSPSPRSQSSLSQRSPPSSPVLSAGGASEFKAPDRPPILQKPIMEKQNNKAPPSPRPERPKIPPPSRPSGPPTSHSRSSSDGTSKRPPRPTPPLPPKISSHGGLANEQELTPGLFPTVLSELEQTYL